MVFLSIILNSAKRLPRKHLRSGFRDSLRIYVHGGHGGSGLPKYGGLGGRGGNVYVVATEKLSLGHVAKQIEKFKCKARPGMDSSAKGIIGKPGEDLELSVPCGVTVFKDKVLLGEVNEPGSKLLVARGGLGGCPETGYCGEKGESHAINLDLKLIADVGLVGFPNAGKSTLLKAISNASPKIANYPFTTIRPQLGTIQYNDHRTITVADLPGLIEGAHMNFGMGHQFLKHLDRTKLLLFVVDIQGFQLSRKYVYRNCLETVILLNKEIELYKPDLLNMPAMLVVNKMDTKDAHGLYEDIKEKLNNLQDIVPDYPEEMQPEKVLQFSKILTMSLISKNREEIDNLKMNIRSILDKYEEEKQIALQETSLEEKLYERLALETKQHTPSLI